MRGWWVAAAMLSACNSEEAGPPSVLLIVLDGVRTDELTGTLDSPLTGGSGECWGEETWAGFGAEGTVVRAIVNQGVTVTAPAHVQMLTGRVDPFANFSIPDEGPGWYLPEYPNVFEELRGQLGLDATDARLLANTTLLEPVAASLNPAGGFGATHLMVADGDLPSREDRPVLEAIQGVVDLDRPRLLVVNFHDADRAGHFGDVPDYVEGVAEQDLLLGELHGWLAKEHPGYAENLLVIVTADHGRHRDYLDEMWRSHGDSCAGCREVPLFLVGKGIAAGKVAEGTYSGIDLAPTMAGWLGVDAPWAQGLPLSPLVPSLTDVAARRGDVDLALADGHVATRRYRAEFESRSEVVVDDVVVSTPGAYAAEAPSVVALDDRLVACFRELHLTPGADEWPWTARCATRIDGAWADMDFAEPDGGPTFLPVLLPWRGGLAAFWTHNPNGIAELGVDGDVGLRAAAWTPTGGWAEHAALSAYFPTHLTAARLGDVVLVAFTTNDGDEDGGGWSRRTRVARWDGAVLELLTDVGLDRLLGDSARVERPALSVDGDVARLAVLGIGDESRGVWALESVDSGATWGQPHALPSGGDPFPNVAPAWDGDAVVWAASEGGAARICRATLADAAAECVDAGSARVDGLEVSGGAVWITRDAGVGEWETALVEW